VKDARWRAQGEGKWQVILTTSMENATREPVHHGDWQYEALIVARRAFNVACFTPFIDVVEPELVSDGRVGFEVTCKPVGYIELMVNNRRIRVSKAREPGAC